MREIAWASPVIERHDQSWRGRLTPHSTCGLNVLGGCLRLPHDRHESEAVDIDPDGNHVARQHSVDWCGTRLRALNIVWLFEPPEQRGNAFRGDPAREFLVDRR